MNICEGAYSLRLFGSAGFAVEDGNTAVLKVKFKVMVAIVVAISMRIKHVRRGCQALGRTIRMLHMSLLILLNTRNGLTQY